MKKTLSFILALGIFVSSALPVMAQNPATTVGTITDGAFYNYEGNAAIRPEKTTADDYILIPLVKEGFWDESGVQIDWDGNQDLGPTVSALKRNRIVPRLLIAAGKDVIRDIELVKYTPTNRVRANAAIRVRFVERLVSTKEITYQFRILLDMGGNPTYVRETFGGMISNQHIDVYPGINLDYADLYGSVVLNCVETTDNVVADLDNGVRAYLDMVQGGKFYGYSEMDHTTIQDVEKRQSNDPVLQKYEEVKYAYSVTSINVKNMLKYLRITVPGDQVYFVYNEYGDYIGQTTDNLPYSTRYYLATKEVEIDPVLAGKPIYTVDYDKIGADLRRFIGQA